MIKILAKIDNFLQLTSVLLVILFPGNLREFDEHSANFIVPLASHIFLLSSVPWGLIWMDWACDLCTLPSGEFLHWEGNGQAPWVGGSGMRRECLFSSCLPGSFHS